MSQRAGAGQIGDRIERLLEEVRSTLNPAARDQVDELIGLILELHGSGLERIIEIAAREQPSASPLIERFTQDQLISSLLVLHGLHPEDFPTRVDKALARVRPYLDSHGGNVELIEADQAAGVVRLRLAGSCQSCPSSRLTVKMAVESALRELVPELGAIEVDGLEQNFGAALNGPGGRAPKWMLLDRVPALNRGGLTRIEIGGAGIVLCRLGQSLYAYMDWCPQCGKAVAGGALEGSTLACPSCAQRYDVRLAGRSAENRALHLEPVPVIEDAGGVKIALDSPA